MATGAGPIMGCSAGLLIDLRALHFATGLV
jgi:hypothetical protein